jgi:hypothetical protein
VPDLAKQDFLVEPVDGPERFLQRENVRDPHSASFELVIASSFHHRAYEIADFVALYDGSGNGEGDLLSLLRRVQLLWPFEFDHSTDFFALQRKGEPQLTEQGLLQRWTITAFSDFDLQAKAYRLLALERSEEKARRIAQGSSSSTKFCARPFELGHVGAVGAGLLSQPRR